MKFVVDHALSAALALVVAAVMFGCGLPTHLEHGAAGRRQERALLRAVQAVPDVQLIAGSATHRTIGYADVRESCAAKTTVDVRSVLGVDLVRSRLAGRMLPHLDVEPIGDNKLRVQTLQTFGLNPFDWSCWQ